MAIVIVVVIPTAYVFINCNSGAEERIIQEVADLPEVIEGKRIMAVFIVFLLCYSTLIIFIEGSY